MRKLKSKTLIFLNGLQFQQKMPHLHLQKKAFLKEEVADLFPEYYLLNNINIYNLKNIKVINDSSINFNNNDMIEINPNVIFIDPPWGGVWYRNNDLLKLTLGDIPIEELIIDIFDKFYTIVTSSTNSYSNRLIVLKLPKNYDIEYIYNYIKNEYLYYIISHLSTFTEIEHFVFPLVLSHFYDIKNTVKLINMLISIYDDLLNNRVYKINDKIIFRIHINYSKHLLIIENLLIHFPKLHQFQHQTHYHYHPNFLLNKFS